MIASALAGVLLLAQLGELPGESARRAGRVGVEVRRRNNALTIESVDERTSAADAGLHIGDQILRIDREDVTGLSGSLAMARLRGVLGTHVTLTVLPRAAIQPRTLEVLRDVHVFTDESRDVGAIGGGSRATAKSGNSKVVATLTGFALVSGQASTETLQPIFENAARDVAACVLAVGEMLPATLETLTVTATRKDKDSLAVRTDPVNADAASCIGRSIARAKLPKPGSEPIVVRAEYRLERSFP